jgi:hypothetical protein
MTGPGEASHLKNSTQCHWNTSWVPVMRGYISIQVKWPDQVKPPTWKFQPSVIETIAQ